MPDTGQIQETETIPEVPLSVGELRARREKKGGFMGWQRDAPADAQPAQQAEQAAGDAPAPTGDRPADKEAKAPESAPAEKAEPAKGGEDPKPSDGDGTVEATNADAKTKDPVAALLEKYGSEDKLADAYLHLQRKFTGTAEDLKEAQNLVNEYFELGADGKLELRTEAAARRLGKERGQTIPIDEKAVRAEVHAKYAGLAEDTEDPSAFLELPKTKKLIEDDTKKALAEKRQEIEQGDMREGLRVAQLVDGFFKVHPAAEKYRDQMDEWLDDLPQKTAMRLLREGGVNLLTRLYRAAKAQGDLEPRVREAFETGLSVGKESLKLKSGAGNEAGSTSPKRELGPDGGDAGFKTRVVGSGKRGVMDALLKGAK